MSAMPERRETAEDNRNMRNEINRVLSRLDRTLSALRAEIEDVQRVINEREP